ncbi:heterokaryon incompatibility protein-domain-containing protein [Podospora didyma]|uniref:Heterokaryon incompatibility protein-domain-containing protein n=1 Tax=Podospora didyma TaxID=330526 RepID=A0AAE0JVT8_9PEZI|nr:heterokaryon incompatibility protein-domain-containing protein [Podospora didyma]
MEDEKPRFHCPENSAFYKGGHYCPLIQMEKKSVSSKRCRPTTRIPMPFIAMSYCAGDPNKTIPVFIDGEVFNVFESLGRALRALLLSLGRNKESTSQLEDTLYIWADQICINQSDGTEKSSQVLMMCQIYEHCAWAYSWLGTDPHVSKGLLGSRMLDLVQQKIDSYYEDKGELWPTWAPMVRHRDVPQERPSGGTFDIIDPSSNKTGFRELVAKPFSKQDLADLTPREGWKDSKGYSLENLLLVARHSEVTDPLDRVPPRGVYTEATVAYIKRHKGLNILSFAEDRTEILGPELPSWAGPNASRKMPYHTIDLLPGPNGEPDRVLRVPVIPIDIIADRRPQSAGRTNDVFYEGIADVDMIRKMWDSLSSMDDPDDPDPDSGEEEKEEAEVEAEEDIYSGPAEEGDAAAGAAKALKALSLDHDQDDKEKKKDDVKRGDDGGNKTDDDGGNLVEEDGTGDGNDRSDDSDEKTLRSARSWTWATLQRGNWKFLRTESGCFALTRAASVQDGDIIMVLIGADTPFLMRRHLDGYKLVGEVYVQGIMRGESLDDVEVTTDGGLVLDYIKIY